MIDSKAEGRDTTDWMHSQWPLGGNTHAVEITEFEWAVMRFFSAFERSCLQLGVTAGVPELSFQDLVVLHVIGMQPHPQGVAALARQLNRDDLANLQYALRKLQKKGLVDKADRLKSKVALYELTDKGARLVQRYAEIRQALLTRKTELLDDIDTRMEASTQLLSILTGIYDDVARTAATYSAYSEPE